MRKQRSLSVFKTSIIIGILSTLSFQGLAQGDSCGDPIDLNPDIPVNGNGTYDLTVDNSLSNQFYTYTATQDGHVEMSSAFSNVPGDGSFDPYLRVYDEMCDLIFEEDNTPGLFGNVEFHTQVSIGDSYIFEWSNEKWAGVFDVEFIYHESVTGESCNDPVDLAFEENTVDFWFGDQYYTHTAESDGLLEISTCGLWNSGQSNIVMLDACNGSEIGTSSDECDYDSEGWESMTYNITADETIIIKMLEAQHKHYDYTFNAMFTPQGDSCAIPFDLTILPEDLHQVPHECTTCRTNKWYKFIAPKGGPGIVTTGMAALARHGGIGGQENTYIKVYSVCDGEPIAENDNYYQFFGSSLVSIDFQERETYYIEFIADNINDSYYFDIFYEEDLLFGTEEAPLEVILGLNDIHANMYYAGEQYEIGEQWFTYEFISGGELTMNVTEYSDRQTLISVVSDNEYILTYPDEDSGPDGFIMQGAAGDVVKFGLSQTNNTFSASFAEELCQGEYTQLEDGDLGDDVEVDNSLGNHIFRYTASMDGTLLISSCGQSDGFNSYVKLYELCNETILEESDDFCGEESRLSFPVSAGITYEIIWDAQNIPLGTALVEFVFYMNYLENIPGKTQEEAIELGEEQYSTHTRYIEQQWFTYTLPENGVLNATGFDPGENSNSVLLITDNDGLINLIDPIWATYTGMAGDQVYIVWNSNFGYEGIEFDVQFSPAIVWSAGEWSNEVGPEEGDNVIITDIYSTDFFGSFPVNDLTITETGEIEIGSGSSLDVQGNLTNSGIINVQSGASLFTYEANSISGNPITFVRNTRYADGRYSMVGSPVLADAEITGADLGPIVYSYDETIAFNDGTEDGESRWLNASAVELTSGKGYGTAGQQTITFVGVPNDGTISFSGLSRTEDATTTAENWGWHLVSNPYPAALDLQAFIDGNSGIQGFVALWDDPDSEVGRGDNGDYLIANAIGSVTGPNGGSFEGYIGSMQGFFIQVGDGQTGDVVFNEDMRIADNNADANFFRKADTPIPSIKLAMISEDHYSETLIGFPTDATSDHDQLYDATKLKSQTNHNLYSMLDSKPYAIQGLPLHGDEIRIPLGLDKGERGLITLSLQSSSSEFNQYELLIFDKSSKKEYPFSTSKSLEFMVDSGVEQSRFELILRKFNVLGTTAKKRYIVFADDDHIHVKGNGEMLINYRLVNLMGQVVSEARDWSAENSDFSIINPDKPGIYLLQLNYSQTSEVYKLIIK